MYRGIDYYANTRKPNREDKKRKNTSNKGKSSKREFFRLIKRLSLDTPLKRNPVSVGFILYTSVYFIAGQNILVMIIPLALF